MRISKQELERHAGCPHNELMTCAAAQLRLRPGSWPRRIEVTDGVRTLMYRHAADDLDGDGAILGRRYRTRSGDEILVIND